VLRAHPGHPDLSRATATLVLSALKDSGAPDGTFGLIEGEQAGADAVSAPCCSKPAPQPFESIPRSTGDELLAWAGIDADHIATSAQGLLTTSTAG
jgi:hypothetical protein